MSWRTVGGVNWLSVETPDGHDDVELGLVIAHGYAHESPADLGIGAAAIAALTRLLARPIETPDHRIVEASVTARVGLQESIIAVRGDLAAVQHAAAMIERLLKSPEELEGSGRPDPRRFAWTGWSRELAAWFGVGTVSIAAENVDPWIGDQARFADFVRSLHPASGRAMVAWSDAPELVGTVFAGPGVRPSLSTHPLAWRDPAPSAAAGSVTGSFANNLLTVRMPSGPLTELALIILGQTVQRSLVVLTQLVESLEVTWEAVGADELYALRAVPHEGTTDWVEVRTALIQAVDAIADMLDPLLAQHLSAARDSVSTRNPVVRAIETLRTGVRSGAAMADDMPESATIDDLRRSLQQVQAATLVSVPSNELASPERPLLVTPAPRTGQGPTVKRRSRFPVWLRDIPDRQRIRADASSLQQTLLPKYAKATPGALKQTTEVIDLTRLAARVDEGAELSTLIDVDDRRVTLTWPAYFRPAALRRLVDGATPAGATIQRTADPIRVAQLRSDARKATTSTILASGLLLIALVLIVWHPVTGTPTGDYQVPVVTTVPIGTVVPLGNGSTVQVSNPTWKPVETSTHPVLVIDVRYCGGGVTVDRNTAADARNYIGPDRFELAGIAAASRQTYIFSGPELKATELQDGQCAQGKLAFDIDADKPDGIQVAYHNGSGDNLTWTFT